MYPHARSVTLRTNSDDDLYLNVSNSDPFHLVDDADADKINNTGEGSGADEVNIAGEDNGADEVNIVGEDSGAGEVKNAGEDDGADEVIIVNYSTDGQETETDRDADGETDSDAASEHEVRVVGNVIDLTLDDSDDEWE